MHTYNDFILDMSIRSTWKYMVDLLSYYRNVEGTHITGDFFQLVEGYVLPINTSRQADDYPLASTYDGAALNKAAAVVREFEWWLRYMENSTPVTKEVSGMKEVSMFTDLNGSLFTLSRHPISGLWHAKSLYFHQEFGDIVLAHQYYEMLMRHNFYEWYEKEES